MTKVSVVVPIYGVEKYLRECLDSIISQTLTDIEIILVDDGGKDSCPAICDEYAQKDSRIKVIHKENGGYGTAINAGLDVATGEYVGIVEADDFIASDMYESYYKLAKQYDVDVVKGVYYEITEDSSRKSLPSHLARYTKVPKDVFHITEYPDPLNYHASIWAGVYRRSFLEQHNIRMFEKNKGRYADQVWRYETLLLADNIHWVETPYYYYRVFSQNNTTSVKGAKTPDDIFDLYVELNEFFNSHKELYEQVKENYFIEIYEHSQFNLHRCDISCTKYILDKFREMFAAQIPVETVQNMDRLTDREKHIFISMLNGRYFLIYMYKKILRNIFSLTNSADRAYKIITILGNQIRIKRSLHE